jgi:hypothetical protein
LSPMTAARAALGVIAFMNAALGARFLAGAFANTELFTTVFGATFLLAAFLTATFFAVAMRRSPLEVDAFVNG